MNLLRIFKKIILLGPRKFLFYINIFVLLGINRYKSVKFEFKVLAKEFGIANRESSKKIMKDNLEIVKNISEGINIVSRLTPWKSTCLVKAMVGKRLLLNKNIDSTIYLGVKRENDKLMAHAWLRCGEIFVTGEGCVGFGIVKCFSGIIEKPL